MDLDIKIKNDDLMKKILRLIQLQEQECRYAHSEDRYNAVRTYSELSKLYDEVNLDIQYLYTKLAQYEYNYKLVENIMRKGD
ncbi:hypothetical protein [Holdemanella porci]|uniref:hypothetical protein n=1 Tax=Holdemanella porci TaxID=2652276 RepID=UPI003AB25CFA